MKNRDEINWDKRDIPSLIGFPSLFEAGKGVVCPAFTKNNSVLDTCVDDRLGKDRYRLSVEARNVHAAVTDHVDACIDP